MSVLLSESSPLPNPHSSELFWGCIHVRARLDAFGVGPCGTMFPYLRPPSLPKDLWGAWGRSGLQGIDPFGRQLLHLSCVVPYHTPGVILWQTGSAAVPITSTTTSPHKQKGLLPVLVWIIAAFLALLGNQCCSGVCVVVEFGS